jgi:hypothetical protein
MTSGTGCSGRHRPIMPGTSCWRADNAGYQCRIVRHDGHSSPAAGDIEAARVAYNAAGALLGLIPKGKATEAARAAHDAVGKLLASMTTPAPPLGRPNRK